MDNPPAPANRRRLLVCTTGTSIAQGCPSLRRYFQADYPWDRPADDLAAEIAARLQGQPWDNASRVRQLSAELNSLSRLGAGPGDQVALLATDTAEGRVCAEALEGAIRLAFRLPGERDVEIFGVPGLQIRRAWRLRHQGIPELIKTILALRADALKVPGCQVILNPTGGYKGVVPFLAILGMLFRLKSVYVFEFSETLIELPPLPVTFDLDLFERARPALVYALEQSSVALEEFLCRIPHLQYHERELFMGFLELEENGKTWALSPLACVLVGVSRAGARQVKISPAVLTRARELTGAARERFLLLLDRVAEPLWRTRHLHAFSGTDLEVYKQGNVPERLAGITRDGAFYLCEYYGDHDLYEKDLPRRKEHQYRLETFLPWQGEATLTALEEEAAPDQAEAPGRADPAGLALRQLEREKLEMRRQLAKLERQVKDLQEQLRHERERTGPEETGKEVVEPVDIEYIKNINTDEADDE